MKKQRVRAYKLYRTSRDELMLIII